MKPTDYIDLFHEQLAVELEELLSNKPTTQQVEELLAKYGYHQDLAYKLQDTKATIGLWLTTICLLLPEWRDVLSW